MSNYRDNRLKAKLLTYFLVFRDFESARVIFPTFYESLDELIDDRFKTEFFPVAFIEEMERLEIYKIPKNLNFTLYDYVDLKNKRELNFILSKIELKYVEELKDNKEFDKSWMLDEEFNRKWKD